MSLLALLKRSLPLLLLVLWGPCLLAAAYLDKRVVVHLKTGGKVSGIVVGEKPDGTLTLLVSGGRVSIKSANIKEVVVQKSPEEEFKERAAKCSTADDWVKLAKWCALGDVRLPEKRKECLEKALELDPDHEGAHKELGHVKVRGKWYPEDEGNKLLGKVKYKGKWYPPDEAARLKRRDELRKKNKYLQGLLEQEEERRGIPWTEAEVIETEHYRVKCNSTKKVAQRYADIMEALYRAYDEIFSETDFPRDTDEKGTIYIFRNNDEFNDFQLLGPGIGGFYSFADRAVRAYHGSFGVTGSTEMVLAHEATHQFQDRIMVSMRAAPTWLIEGMAVYYGDGTEITRKKVTLHKIPRDRLQTLQEAIETGRYTKLHSLLRIPQGMFGGQFYDHAWGVIYWCLQGQKYGAHKGEGKRVWDQYLQHVARDLPDFSTVVRDYAKHLDSEAKYFENLLLKETGYKTIDEWERGYKQFILDLQLEPLGKWSGLAWNGSEKVGIRMKFPRGLKPVEEKHLRQRFREAAAAQSAKGDVRAWITVDANWFGKADLGPELLDQYLKGFFRRKGKYLNEPKIVQVNKGLSGTIASFRGKLARRRERSTFSVNRGGGKSKKKGSEKKKGTAKSREPKYPVLDSNRELRFKVALLATTDKIYVVSLAGLEGPFSKVEPAFDKALESIVLTFKRTKK